MCPDYSWDSAKKLPTVVDRRQVRGQFNYICDGKRNTVYSHYVFQVYFFEIVSPALQRAHIKIAENLLPGYFRRRSCIPEEAAFSVEPV